MPLYVYACPTCEIEVEELRSMARADDPVDCPICQSALTRAVTTFSLNGRAQAPKTAGPSAQPTRHAVGCPCCVPPPRLKPPSQQVG